MPLACARSFLFRVLLLYTLCLQPEASLCLPSFRLGHPSTAEHTHSLPPLGPHLPCRRRRLATHHHSYSQATSNTDTDDAGFEDENGPPEGAASRDGGGGATTAAAASLAAPAELRGGVLSSGDDEGRWHDAMHRALMESLQPPRSEHPTWWGKRFHNLQVWWWCWDAGLARPELSHGSRTPAACLHDGMRAMREAPVLLPAAPRRLPRRRPPPTPRSAELPTRQAACRVPFHAAPHSPADAACRGPPSCAPCCRSAAWLRCWKVGRLIMQSSGWYCLISPSCSQSWCSPPSTPPPSWRRTWVGGG